MPDEVKRRYWPWSVQGTTSDIPLELQTRLDRLGSVKANPAGYSSSAPIHRLRGPARNPYIALTASPASIVMALVILDRMGPSSWLAWTLSGLFALCGIFIFAINAIRIRRWHRARRVIKQYIAKNGGKMPAEYRIWS